MMSLASTLRKAAYAAPLVFALAASNAHAESRIVELTDLDLSKPLPSNICFVDSAKGTAASKLNTALQARNQKSIIISDKVAKDGNAAFIFSSNLVQVYPDVPNLFGEGYDINTEQPSNVVASKYCMSTLRKTYVVYNESVKIIPGVFGQGEMGQALTNLGKNGIKLAYGGITDKGTLISMNFNGQSKKGAVFSADGKGNTAVFFPVENARYSPNLSADAKAIIGLPPLAQ